jgi:oleate hydratase
MSVFYVNGPLPYDRFHPLPTPGVEKRKIYTVGAGLSALAAAFVAIRDCHVPGENITLLELGKVSGGGVDGAGSAAKGYILRGGHEMEPQYNCFFDLFADVPAPTLGKGYSVLDEIHQIEDADPNWSNCRLIRNQGERQDNSSFELDSQTRGLIMKLLLARESDVEGVAINQYFPPAFFKTVFWTLWRTMFAFHDWESLLEVKRYMHRFLPNFWGFKDMSTVEYPAHNQYEDWIKPLEETLAAKGVHFEYGCNVLDLDLDLSGGRKVVKGIKLERNGNPETIKVDERDLVLVTNGSLIECTGYGDMHHRAPLITEEHGGCWNLWRTLAAKDPSFGRPDVFTPGWEKSAWESFTITAKKSALTDKIAELSGHDPFAHTKATGGIITITDSAWVMSFTVNRQPQFFDQPDDVIVIWGYGLLQQALGDHVKKTMAEATGEEILEELCYHLGILDQFDDIKAMSINIPTMLPYITSFFQVRKAGDRPQIIPEGSVNLGFMGEFVETPSDCAFTLESAIHTGEDAVYQLLGVNKRAPANTTGQYDIRNMLMALQALYDDHIPGANILAKVLGGTYFENLLKLQPPHPGWKATPAPGTPPAAAAASVTVSSDGAATSNGAPAVSGGVRS